MREELGGKFEVLVEEAFFFFGGGGGGGRGEGQPRGPDFLAPALCASFMKIKFRHGVERMPNS